jgi:Leucine-rich repeat (LRR) protein
MNPIDEFFCELLWILESDQIEIEDEYLTKLSLIKTSISEIEKENPLPDKVTIDQSAAFRFFLTYLEQKFHEVRN